jgi:hypothetical protein
MENLRVVNQSLAKMTLDYNLHLNSILMDRLKKMLNDKQVSIAGLFKDTDKNMIFIENKKALSRVLLKLFI